MHPAEEPVYRRSGKPDTVIPVREGDSLDLGDRELRIIHLPGHTPGSIAVLDVQNRVLFSGDPVQEHGRVFMFGIHRSMKDYISSLEHLEGFADQFDEIWPSTRISLYPPPLSVNCATALKPSWMEQFKVNRRNSLVRALSFMIWDSAHCCAVTRREDAYEKGSGGMVQPESRWPDGRLRSASCPSSCSGAKLRLTSSIWEGFCLPPSSACWLSTA